MEKKPRYYIYFSIEFGKILFDGKKYLIKYALGHKEPCSLSVYNTGTLNCTFVCIYPQHGQNYSKHGKHNLTLVYFRPKMCHY